MSRLQLALNVDDIDEAVAFYAALFGTEPAKRRPADQVQASDVVITMGCGNACPFYPGKRYLDWDLPDPAGLDLEGVRPIRDEIRQRVRQLLGELDAPA